MSIRDMADELLRAFMEARNNEEYENEGAGKVASEWGPFAPRSSPLALAPRLLDPLTSTHKCQSTQIGHAVYAVRDRMSHIFRSKYLPLLQCLCRFLTAGRGES
jgi:hypothetical protein